MHRKHLQQNQPTRYSSNTNKWGQTTNSYETCMELATLQDKVGRRRKQIVSCLLVNRTPKVPTVIVTYQKAQWASLRNRMDFLSLVLSKVGAALPLLILKTEIGFFLIQEPHCGENTRIKLSYLGEIKILKRKKIQTQVA